MLCNFGEGRVVYAWSGSANEGGVPVVINQLSFNQNATKMITVDNKDSKPLITPVLVDCTSATTFTLTYSDQGKSNPAMIDFRGKLQQTANGYIIDKRDQESIPAT